VGYKNNTLSPAKNSFEKNEYKSLIEDLIIIIIIIITITILIIIIIYLFIYCKNKDKVHPITCHEGTAGDLKYSCTLLLTPSLDGVGDHRNRWFALSLEMTRYPFGR
jgi:heme/copper-type cytochrome/quinol oxidase subunit 2